MKFLLGMFVAALVTALGFFVVSVTPISISGLFGISPPPAMVRRDVQRLGFSVAIPDQWEVLDDAGFRRLLTEFNQIYDETVVQASIRSMVVAAISGWPKSGPEASVMINHHQSPKRNVTDILNSILANKKKFLPAVELVTPPTEGTLGGFEGGYLSTRDEIWAHEKEMTTLWALRVRDGYLIISAGWPESDSSAAGLVEAMFTSLRKTDGG